MSIKAAAIALGLALNLLGGSALAGKSNGGRWLPTRVHTTPLPGRIAISTAEKAIREEMGGNYRLTITGPVGRHKMGWRVDGGSYDKSWGRGTVDMRRGLSNRVRVIQQYYP